MYSNKYFGCLLVKYFLKCPADAVYDFISTDEVWIKDPKLGLGSDWSNVVELNNNSFKDNKGMLFSRMQQIKMCNSAYVKMQCLK